MCTCSNITSTVFATTIPHIWVKVQSRAIPFFVDPALCCLERLITYAGYNYTSVPFHYYDYVIMIADAALILWLDRHNKVCAMVMFAHNDLWL